MAYALAQNPTAANGSGASSISKTFASTVTAHSLLVAFVTTDATTPGTFTATGGGTWASIAAIKETSSTQWLCILYCLDATGGTAPTVQVSWTGAGTFNGLVIAEFTNGGVTSVHDTHTAGSLGNSTAPTDSAMTATDADAVVSWAIAGAGTNQPTAGATFTFGTNQDTTDLAAWEYKVLAGAGSVTPVFAISAAVPWGIISAAFGPAGATAVAPMGPARPGRTWLRHFRRQFRPPGDPSVIGPATQLADAALAVTASFAAAATGTRPADSGLAVTTTLTAAATGTRPADAALAVTTTLAAAGTVTSAGVDASLPVTTTLTGAAVYSGMAAASLPVTNTLAAATTASRPVDASLVVTATLAAAATRTAIVTASLPVTTTLAAALTYTAVASASLAVTNTLTASTATVASASLALTATLTAAATRAAPVDSTLSITVTLAATATRTAPVAATLSVTTTLAATAGRLQAVAAALAVVTAFIASAASAGSITFRPNTGTTARPGTGRTSRPFAGTTLRP